MKDMPFVGQETPSLHEVNGGGGVSDDQFTDDIGLAWVRVLESIREQEAKEEQERAETEGEHGR